MSKSFGNTPTPRQKAFELIINGLGDEITTEVSNLVAKLGNEVFYVYKQLEIDLVGAMSALGWRAHHPDPTGRRRLLMYVAERAALLLALDEHQRGSDTIEEEAAIHGTTCELSVSLAMKAKPVDDKGSA